MSLRERELLQSTAELQRFISATNSPLNEQKGLSSDNLLASIDFLDSISERITLSIYYPKLMRIAKSAVVQNPDIYSEGRKRLEDLLIKSGDISDENFRAAKQARAIDLLLEITEKDFRGFGEELPVSVEKSFVTELKKFVRSPTKNQKGKFFGIEIPDFNSRELSEYVKGGMGRYLFNTSDYLERGLEFHYVLDLFYLDLALNASGVVPEVSNADRAFDQALLDISAPYSDKGKGYFRRSISKFIKTNFDYGLIT